MADGASVGRSSQGRSGGASSFDISSMGSREQSDAADSTFSHLEGLGSAGIGRRLLADSTVVYLSAIGRWGLESSWKLQGLFLLYQHVFLALYALHPLWDHEFSFKDSAVGRWTLRLLGHGWATVAEDKSILVGLLVTGVILTIVQVSLAIHLGWALRHKKLPFPGEKLIIRLLEVFYMKLFGLPALGVMLSPLTCEWGATSAAGVKDESLILSGMTCSGSLATLGAVGIVVGLLLHVPLYLGIVLKECEIDPLTKVPFQAGSAPAAFRIEVLKISALVVIHLFAGLSQVGAGLLTTGLWLWIVYVTIVRLPYLGHAHSIVRATLAGGIMWMFGAATVQSTGGDVRVALAAGAVLVAALSGFLAKHRIKKAVGVVTMYYAVRAEVGPNSKRYHRFHDEEEPELLMRVLRQRMAQSTVSQEDKDGLMAAMAQASHIFPNSGDVFLALAAANAFLMNDVHTATSCLQKAKGVRTSLATRLTILLLERVVRKRHNVSKGDSMDWATYVELQDSMRLLLNTHKKAIMSGREVWRVLLKHDIGVDDIATAVKRMDRFELVADEAYRSMLERHPNQPRLLTLYGKFLEEVQGNTHAAARYFQEAEKLEDAVEMRADAEEEDAAAGQAIDDSKDGVCVLNPEGVMTFVNANMAKIFGYKRAEMIGRSVNMLVPPPYAGQHDRFLKNYQATRQRKILNTTRLIVAWHKQRNIFPITLTASVVSQGGQEGFMGIIRKVEEDPRAAIMYISGTGNIISVTKAFTSLSGMPAEDLAGRHASVVFPKAGEVTGFVQDAVSGDLQNKASGGTLEMRSRFGETFQVAATAKVGGSADYPILSVTVVTQGQETPSLVLSASGEVLHCNAALESSVGAPATSIVGSKALDLFTEPYRTYFRDLLRAGDYNTHRFDATVLHGRVIQLAAKGSRGFRGLAAVRHLDAGTTEGNPAAMLTLTPLGPGANAEVPPNLELTIGEDGAVTDCTVHEGPIAALKEAIVGQRVNQLVRMEGNVARHLAYWKTLPESSAPRGMARPTASAPSRPTHVAVSVPGQTAVAAAASWRRCGGATCVSLVPYQTLGIVLEVDQSLKITAVLGQAVLLTGASAESIKGKHLRDVLPGLNGEVADIPSLLASGEKKSGGMKKKRAASGRMPGVAVASTLCTGIQATVQAVSRGTSKAAWVVVDPDPAFAVPALPEPDEGVIQAGTARAEALMAHEGKDKESGSNGGAEGVAEPADEEEKKEEEKKEDEKEEEENGSEGRSGEEGSDEGEGLEKADGAAGSGGWAAQRVEEWVTQGGVVTSGDSVGGYGEATGLSASAVRQLEHGLKGLRTDSMQVDADKIVQASVHGAPAPDAPAPDGEAGQTEGANAGGNDGAAEAAEKSTHSLSGSRNGAAPKPPGSTGAGAALHAGPAPGSDGKGALKEGSSEEIVHAKVRDTKPSEETDEHGDGGEAPGEIRGVEAGAEVAKGEQKGSDEGAVANEQWKGAAAQEDALEKMAGMSTGSGASVGEGNFGGMVSGIGRDVDDDLVDLLGGDSAQVRVKRFKRILGLMQAPVMQHPVTVLKYSIWAIAATITAVHTIGFAVLMVYINRHAQLLEWVDLAGLTLVNIPKIVVHTRIIQLHSVDIHIAGSPTFEGSRAALEAETRQFLEGHATLYETESAFTGKWGKVISDIWLAEDVPVVRPTSDDMFIAELIEETTNTWDLGNRIAAAGLDLAQFTEEQLMQRDLTSVGTYHIISRNGIENLVPRYRMLRDSLFDVTTHNLGLIGTVSIVFLYIEAGLLLPVALFVLKGQLRRVLNTRIRQMSLLLALPRSLAIELWKRPVVIEGVEEDEEEGEDGAGGMAATPGASLKKEVEQKSTSTKTIRALLAQKIGYDRVTVAISQLERQHGRMKGHRKLELRIMGPLLLWAAVAAILYGVTWQLQAETATRLLPIKASHIMLTLLADLQESALRLVGRAINMRLGSPWIRADTGQASAAMQTASNEIVKAAFSLIYGTNDLLGRYYIPKGTVFRVTGLLDIYFNSKCYRKDQSLCVSDDDPMHPILQAGYVAMVVSFSEDADMLSRDGQDELHENNENFVRVMTYGDTVFLEAGKDVHRTLVSYLGDMWLIQAIHIILLVFTLTMCLSYLLFVMRPLRQLVDMEARRLGMLLAQLPRELAVDEALVAMLTDMSKAGEEEDRQLVEEDKEPEGAQKETDTKSAE